MTTRLTPSHGLIGKSDTTDAVFRHRGGITRPGDPAADPGAGEGRVHGPGDDLGAGGSHAGRGGGEGAARGAGRARDGLEEDGARARAHTAGKLTLVTLNKLSCTLIWICIKYCKALIYF